MTRPQEAGFTLVELLVALFIFGLLSAAGVALLSFSVRAQDAADTRLDALSALRRANALIGADLAQATSRISRDEAGAVRPAFDGAADSLMLVRRGWENFDGAPRASLQKVEYRLVGDRLERRGYFHVDGAPPLESVTLLSGVRRMGLRYRDASGAWRERWDPTRITDLPRAVELVADSESQGTVRQLFAVGAPS